MARRFKSAIINDDRTISVNYINKKLKVGHKLFRPTRKSRELYLIDPKYSIITTTKRLGMSFRYTTFYYKRNVPIPLDFPEMHGGIALGKQAVDETGANLIGEDNQPIVEIVRPIELPAFDNWKYNSISSEELDKLLDPNFVAMVARANKKQNEQLLFYIMCGVAVGVAFLIYYVMQNLPGSIATKVAELFHAASTGK